MKSIAGKELQSFEEAVLGTKVTVFGNIAIAIVTCAIKENGITENRTVEMLLLVKETRGHGALLHKHGTEQAKPTRFQPNC